MMQHVTLFHGHRMTEGLDRITFCPRPVWFSMDVLMRLGLLFRKTCDSFRCTESSPQAVEWDLSPPTEAVVSPCDTWHAEVKTRDQHNLRMFHQVWKNQSVIWLWSVWTGTTFCLIVLSRTLKWDGSHSSRSLLASKNVSQTNIVWN